MSEIAHGQAHDHGGLDPVPGSVPLGTGVWWYGTLGTLPEGWQLCDGTLRVNGQLLPDMRDKMPIGAGTTYALGATGGAAPSLVTLAHDKNHTNAAVAAHSHHTHNNAGLTAGVTAGADATVVAQQTPLTGNESASLTHTVTQPDAHSDHTFTPSLPPYAAWFFIVRVA